MAWPWGKSQSQFTGAVADPDGIYLGRHLNRDTGKVGRELFYRGDRHLVLLGPNRSGKGSGLLANNLLRPSRNSWLVLDTKGELFAITASYRMKIGRVVVLDPFGVTGHKSARFNPLVELDPASRLFFDDASGVAESLITSEHSIDSHWNSSAEALLAAIIMWEVVLARREQRAPSLANVRYLLTEPDEVDLGPDGKRHQVAGLRLTAARMCVEGGPTIAGLISRFLRESNEISSIQSTADRQTRWILSTPIEDSLSGHNFDFADLRNDDEITTVYLVLPFDRLQTHARWLRCVIGTALRKFFRRRGRPIYCLLDEFASLGRMSEIESSLGLAGGLGVRLWTVLQDLNQLKGLYRDNWESFLSNAGVVQAFGPNDLTTADWLSRRAGEFTVVSKSFNQGDSRTAQGVTRSENLSFQQGRRRLYLVQDLVECRRGTGIILPAGTSMNIPFYAPPYWTDPAVAGRADPNPYYQPSDAAE